jgi:glycosyltransferase involved in cell wall biosynthesis
LVANTDRLEAPAPRDVTVTPTDTDCRLSVLLVTYNQERYIHQALQSLFGQVIGGPIELVVADDGSTDRTVDVIAEHGGKDPRFRFVYLEHSSNLGITRNYQRGFAACSGQYVAVLEGDDYWTSPEKLLRQCKFLDAHWECDLCAVNYFTYDEDRAQFTARTAIGSGHRLLGAREQIFNNLASNFSTCMYRKTALDSLPQGLFETTSYDWIVNICVARRSLIGFLEEPMSVYRLHGGGVWTKTPYADQLRSQLDLIPTYDALTDYIFTSEFTALARRLRNDIAHGKGPESASQPRTHAISRFIEHTPSEVVEAARVLVPSAVRRFLVRVLYADS